MTSRCPSTATESSSATGCTWKITAAEFWRFSSAAASEQVYNIGGLDIEENLTIARTLLRLIGKPESLLSYVKDRPGHDRRYALHCDKMEKDLGWKPAIPLEEGLRQTIDWYKTNAKWMAGGSCAEAARRVRGWAA